MATHRRTEYADALLDHGASLQTIAERLLAREVGERERLDLGLRIGRQIIAVGELSEAIRRGERARQGRGEALSAA